MGQNILRIILLVFGVVQIVTNLLYIIKKNGIGLARKQHTELPKGISDRKMKVKVVCMLIFGVLFCLASVTAFIPAPAYLFSMLLILVLFSLYSFIEALCYKYWKVFGFAAATIVLLTSFIFVELDGFSIYREDFMVSKSNSNAIYETQSSGKIYSPFNLKLESMEWLMPLTMENDPDEVYISFEPQVFDDDVSGKGIRILAARKDGYTDVYYQSGLICDKGGFSQVGKGLSELIERPMKDSKYAMTPQGLDFYCSFDDKNGREIIIKVKENKQKQSKPSSILAPLGSSADSPNALPVYMLHEFNFVTVNGTEVLVSIAGQEHQVDTVPILIDWKKIYLMRYSTDPFLVKWNAAAKEELKPLEASGKLQMQDQETKYELIDNNGHYEIKEMSIANEKHKIGIYFKPALPDMISLRDGVDIKGRVTVAAEKEAGAIRGDYELSRQGSKIKINICLNKGWRPNEPKWSMKFLYAMVPMFREWPKTYTWTADIELNENNHPSINSKWARNDR